MAYLVKFAVPERELGKEDLEFKVRRDKKVIGTLKVSKGGLEWVPKDKTYGHHLKWEQVDTVLTEKGKKK
jgi:hypothetical protein